MLETCDPARKVGKAEYQEALSALRVDLLNAQFLVRESDFPVIIVLSGDDRDGVSEVLNGLHQWMDPRYLEAHFFGRRRNEEFDYPRLWRYWRSLPGCGEIGVYAGGYALGLLADQLTGEHGAEEAARRLDDARHLEKMLADDGALFLKIWLHLPRDVRREQLADERARPRLDEIDREFYERYDEAEPLVKALLESTNTETAPWHLIDSSEPRHRNLAVARAIVEGLTRRLEQPTPDPPAAPPSPNGRPRAEILPSIDLGAELPKTLYRERLEGLGHRLWELGVRCRENRTGSAVVLEGWDASGKGGVIRRITMVMDVQDYRVTPVSVPTSEELDHHYLWRFWRRLPPAGRMWICDRSWYGRVLVERVEGLATDPEWLRAYDEINAFESQMVAHGMPVVKFWLHIDPATQLERFEARARSPFKKYKLTAEDRRNRDKWSEYEAAVEDMLARTSTEHAPWHVIPSNDKRHSRIRVLETVCEALEKALG